MRAARPCLVQAHRPPEPLIEGGLPQPKFPLGRPFKSPLSPCRLALGPSMNGPQARYFGQSTVAGCPACDSIPRKRHKDAAGIWPQCGAQALKFRFQEPPEPKLAGRNVASIDQ